jgi:hypothetical protein
MSRALKVVSNASGDHVGLSRNLPLTVSDSSLFLAPTHLALHLIFSILQSVWLIKKLRYDHANCKHIAEAREVNEKMGGVKPVLIDHPRRRFRSPRSDEVPCSHAPTITLF